MPARKKSLEDHVRDGTWREDRHGPLPPDLAAWRSGDGPPPAPPKKPKGLSREASKFWDEVVRTRGPAVRESDWSMLLVLAKVWVRLQDVERDLDEAETPADKKHAMVNYAILIDKYSQVAQQFGLTPKSRAAMPAAEPAASAKPKVETRPRTRMDSEKPPEVTPPEEPT
jgi:phage terminase small subunit